MGSPETGKLAIAFSVSGPHRACFSAASATAASVAPGGQTLRMQPLALTDAQAFWTPAGVYLNTASYGLPPRTAWDALQDALDDWRGGRTSWEHWGEPAEAARASFARLVGVPVETVAIGPNVSTFVGQIAASIPDGSRVLAPDVEFTSLLFPFLVQEHRGVTVRLVAAHELADAIGPDVDVVAFSAVQMATGEVADLGAIASAAARARRADRRRRDAIRRLASPRCDWLRRGRRACLQVADVAAGHGVHGDPRRPDGRRSFRTRQGGTRATILCRRSSAARSGLQRARAGSTRRRPGSCGSRPHRLSR